MARLSCFGPPDPLNPARAPHAHLALPGGDVGRLRKRRSTPFSAQISAFLSAFGWRSHFAPPVSLTRHPAPTPYAAEICMFDISPCSEATMARWSAGCHDSRFCVGWHPALQHGMHAKTRRPPDPIGHVQREFRFPTKKQKTTRYAFKLGPRKSNSQFLTIPFFGWGGQLAHRPP